MRQLRAVVQVSRRVRECARLHGGREVDDGHGRKAEGKRLRDGRDDVGFRHVKRHASRHLRDDLCDVGCSRTRGCVGSPFGAGGRG